MEVLFHLEDGDEIWKKLADEAMLDERKIIAGNMSPTEVDRTNK